MTNNYEGYSNYDTYFVACLLEDWDCFNYLILLDLKTNGKIFNYECFYLKENLKGMFLNSLKEIKTDKDTLLDFYKTDIDNRIKKINFDEIAEKYLELYSESK